MFITVRNAVHLHIKYIGYALSRGIGHLAYHMHMHYTAVSHAHSHTTKAELVQ